MMDINYPAHRSGPQRLNHNIYDGNKNERTFIINSYSDRPSPWKPDEEHLLPGIVDRATKAVIDFATQGLEKTMNLHNGQVS